MCLCQPFCICIEEVDFDLKASETDAAVMYKLLPCTGSGKIIGHTYSSA